ncbi:MAG TPA: amidohydrolase family protein, partial [Candidatus Acidoferrum sp.]|nr:amidohydrolase family protein [Candidatus Acidoferrum sp.]
MLDLVVRNGSIVDGTGASRWHGDLAINDGYIVGVGEVTSRARQAIDAEGMIIAPGFIDIHTHYDVQVFWDTTLSPSPLHGVTTIVGGNCGFSVAPLRDDATQYLMTMLARVEGMPLSALEAAVPWNWRTTAEYLDSLDGRLAVNAGFMVGHSALRRVVMGDAATEREATPDELHAMKRLLADGLVAGGMGFSSTRASSHNDADGVPVPSRHAAEHELVELAAVCREHPGTVLELLPHAGSAFPEATVKLMAKMSQVAQRPLNWNAIIASARNVDECDAKLSASVYAREHGGRVVALSLPERDTVRLNFTSGFLLDMLPGWERAMALPPDEKRALLRDPQQRLHLYEQAHQRGVMGSGLDLSDWGARTIAETFSPDTKKYEGRLVRDIANEEHKSDFDALVDIVCADGLRTVVAVTFPADSDDDWKARMRILRDPRVVVGASDAGAHLDMAASFNYPTRLLSHGVRRHGALSTEEAVHLLTQVPAQLYGFTERGTL